MLFLHSNLCSIYQK